MAEGKKPKATENKAKDVETKLVKLKLSIKDRLSLKELFPRQSNIITLTLARDIIDKTQISQAEIKKVKLKIAEDGRAITWDDKIATEKNVEFTGAEITFLRSQVDRLDNEKKVTAGILPLCLKIREIQNEETK